MDKEEAMMRTKPWMRTMMVRPEVARTWVMTWKQTLIKIIIIIIIQGLNTTIWPHQGGLKALERACLRIRLQEIQPTRRGGMILVWVHLVGEVLLLLELEEHHPPQVQLRLGQKGEQNKLKVWILFSMHTCDKAWLR
jgi:hypothetical protein